MTMQETKQIPDTLYLEEREDTVLQTIIGMAEFGWFVDADDKSSDDTGMKSVSQAGGGILLVNSVPA